MSEKPYRVEIADRYGVWWSERFFCFEDALVVAASKRGRFARQQHVVLLSNTDRVDDGCRDGLTEDERDRWDAC